MQLLIFLPFQSTPYSYSREGFDLDSRRRLFTLEGLKSNERWEGNMKLSLVPCLFSSSPLSFLPQAELITGVNCFHCFLLEYPRITDPCHCLWLPSPQAAKREQKKYSRHWAGTFLSEDPTSGWSCVEKGVELNDPCGSIPTETFCDSNSYGEWQGDRAARVEAQIHQQRGNGKSYMKVEDKENRLYQWVWLKKSTIQFCGYNEKL